MEYNSIELPDSFGAGELYRDCSKCGRVTVSIFSSYNVCGLCKKPENDRPGAISAPTRPSLRERIIFASDGEIVRRERPDARGFIVGVE